MITWFRYLRLPLLVAAIAGAVFYVRTRPVPVEVHEVETGPLVAEVMGTGTLEARVRATISPKISGRIAEVLVDQGDSIKAGELLARLDDDEWAKQVKVAEATIEAARASLGRFKAEQQQAQSTRVLAESEFNRMSELVGQNAVTQSEFDKAREALEVAKAGVTRADAALLEAEQQVVLAKESLAYQETRFADTRLLAPFDGLVIKRYRDAGAIAVPGSPIIDIISLDELWISAWVDETEMDRLKSDLPARVVFRSEPEKDYQGQVARLGKQSDRETREFVVDVRVVELPENWAIGQRAEVYIEWARTDEVTIVPERLVSRRNGQAGVYVVRKSRAEWQPIEIGLQGREEVEVTKGLAPGDKMVTPVRDNMSLEGRNVQLP
ncbi:efflux RND transporter periplasmic adaptor subunit [Aeoliella mucimassa]|uniref:Macrolide export protein MacA n=1 Tax=Aeoliella mucimassa TaxID=2527972 RepID=A0A518AW23_9BACT|nr:efflux RND transporter periplasmic adaptor subunit [Aeoliella mucimassa]QDU58891.1 Macrolide export protein MacA [Aeoliella mucimassa]